MATANGREAKPHLSKLVDQAAAGKEIVIAKAGKPVAKLVPLREHRPARKQGLLKGKIHIEDDFDAPLPRGPARLGRSCWATRILLGIHGCWGHPSGRSRSKPPWGECEVTWRSSNGPLSRVGRRTTRHRATRSSGV